MGRSLSDRRNRRDGFHRQARQAGFRARAVFKLQDIDHKLQLIRPGSRILDLGCAPGSWLQYCRSRAGKHATLVGIDCLPVDPPIANTRHILGNVLEISFAELLGDLPNFDLVLSDMAPNTTGIRHVDQARSEVLFERALEIATHTLCQGGSFLAKLFQGPAFEQLLRQCRSHFARVKIIKPTGSRSQSIEQYIVARDFLPTELPTQSNK